MNCMSNPDIYCYIYNHGINVYMVDRFLEYIFFISGSIRFICQVQYVH